MDCAAETILEAEQPNAEESPLQIPGWLSNPFDQPDHENENADAGDGVVLQSETQPDLPKENPEEHEENKKGRRVQKNIVIRSKSRSGMKPHVSQRQGMFMESQMSTKY